MIPITKVTCTIVIVRGRLPVINVPRTSVAFALGRAHLTREISLKVLPVINIFEFLWPNFRCDNKIKERDSCQ